MDPERKTPDTVRAFIAVDVAPAVRAELEGLLQKLKRTEAGVGWSRPGAVHVTLRFLGEIAAEEIERADAAMAAAVVGLQPIEIEVGGWGAFPNPRRPRVIWVGLTRGVPQLSRLFERLEAELQSRGFGPADKPFSPHLTLGRVKSGQGLHRALNAMAEFGDRSFGSYVADRVVLFQSRLEPSGAIYSRLRERPLAG